ncbi:hypothetical protein ABZW38_24190 [Streptomyces bacillaris]|uniref:hypothetical protein n=1 Tax=Streptomyces bacillaris TaxID=68179 RepID=UPI003461731A
MAADDAIALDGFLDEETVPGDLHGSTARFRLTVSPTDERADEMILPCTVADSVLAHAVIHDLVPGDKLRVTGYLRLPRTPDEPMWLVVTELAVPGDRTGAVRPGRRRHRRHRAVRAVRLLLRRRRPRGGGLHRDRRPSRHRAHTG